MTAQTKTFELSAYVWGQLPSFHDLLDMILRMLATGSFAEGECQP